MLSERVVGSTLGLPYAHIDACMAPEEPVHVAWGVPTAVNMGRGGPRRVACRSRICAYICASGEADVLILER